uniref:Uncharacterized protein n=1 Tax=Romanomermis culicivorax TaxID=13658 RepID=A0A915HX15_ROMCU
MQFLLVDHFFSVHTNSVDRLHVQKKPLACNEPMKSFVKNQIWRTYIDEIPVLMPDFQYLEALSTDYPHLH